MQPLTLYTHRSGPNPWKVAFYLTELGIPYTEVFLDFDQVKKPSFTSINPNGRVPALYDPNNETTVFESGAILEYIAENFDKDGKLCYPSGKEKYQQLSWLHLQMSGQGPYFGQCAWFSLYHGEKVQSAINRYAAEIKRVLAVIDSHLAATKSNYLVGDKCTYADLAWVPWNIVAHELLVTDWDASVQIPHYWAWHQRLLQREAVRKVWEQRRLAIES
ncbi:hypothetical protein BFW01_g3813 [Lasiodiplodia theobromae]|nr:hypothetical protein BFW01_g3813 [Lasiodiplodia theobromae]